ncbi:hypothetical protein ACUUYP_02055 [Pseudomonas lundensis]
MQTTYSKKARFTSVLNGKGANLLGRLADFQRRAVYQPVMSL